MQTHRMWPQSMGAGSENKSPGWDSNHIRHPNNHTMGRMGLSHKDFSTMPACRCNRRRITNSQRLWRSDEHVASRPRDLLMSLSTAFKLAMWSWPRHQSLHALVAHQPPTLALEAQPPNYGTGQGASRR